MTDKNLYSTKEAAEYLDLTVATLKYHVHKAGNITPRKIGNSFVFTRAQLDQFKSQRRQQGRPPQGVAK